MVKKQKKQEALSVSRLINEVLVAQLSIPFRQIVNDTTFSKYTGSKRPDILISEFEYDGTNDEQYIKNLVAYAEAKDDCKVGDKDWKDALKQGKIKAPKLGLPYFIVTNCKTTYFYNAKTLKQLTLNGNPIRYALFIKKRSDKVTKIQDKPIWMYIIDNDGLANSDKRFPTKLRNNRNGWMHDEISGWVSTDGIEMPGVLGERIRFFRNLRGMTQKWLGQAVGFPQKTADIRMAQYESGSRTPKEDLVKALAGVLEVSPLALRIPDIDSDLGFIHTLFAVEDLHGVRVEKNENEVHIVFDGNKPNIDRSVFQMLTTWAEQAEKYRNGEISKEQYDEWRYTYPEKDTTQHWAKVPSQELSDAFVEAFKDKLK